MTSDDSDDGATPLVCPVDAGQRPDSHGSADARRRDVLSIGALSFAAVGGAAALVPLVAQMGPSADVTAQAAVEVDLSKIAAGSGIKLAWRGQPLFVRHLTAQEIAAADAVPLSALRDPQTLDQRTREGHRQWLVTLGVCTHLGCVPQGIVASEPRGAYGGYYCPCHGSEYDTAARIRSGPAPRNLLVPDYRFASPTTIRIG